MDNGVHNTKEFEPSMSLSRERRQTIGAKCKRLIDAGRMQFLAESGFSNAQTIQYVAQELSGENWLLLASI